MLGSLILYLKGMRIMMFQLSGFYYMFHSITAPKSPRFLWSVWMHTRSLIDDPNQGCLEGNYISICTVYL